VRLDHLQPAVIPVSRRESIPQTSANML